MKIQQLEDLVIAMGGKVKPRLPFWNACDDSPALIHRGFSIPLPDGGEATISAYETNPDYNRPEYKCAADTFRDKFAVNIWRGGKYEHVTNGFVDINPENVEKFLTRFSR